MQANLVYFRSDGQRKDIPLTKPNSVLGRRDDCDLRIPLSGVSRQHCELIVSEDGLMVKDLASSNGTFVNQQRVNEQQLRPGDQLQVGSVMFTTQIDGEPADVMPPTPDQKVAVPSPGDAEVDVELTPEDDAFAQLMMDDSGDEDPISALEALAEDIDEPKEK